MWRMQQQEVRRGDRGGEGEENSGGKGDGTRSTSMGWGKKTKNGTKKKGIRDLKKTLLIT